MLLRRCLMHRLGIVTVLVIGSCLANTPSFSSSRAAFKDSAAVSAEKLAALVKLPALQADRADDLDGDGLPDAAEERIARDYFPALAVSPYDRCPRRGVLYRMRPHPDDASKLLVWYDVLYERDCGARGHLGDNEVFSALIDPAIAPPHGLLALRAVAHQNTWCEAVSTCGRLPGCTPCETAQHNGEPWPVVYVSVNKHGTYLSERVCDYSFICDFGGCQRPAHYEIPLMVNAGEPSSPLVRDLTADGFVRAEYGWGPELRHFEPWKGDQFGLAGAVAHDLQDPAFVIDPRGCF